MTQLGETYKQLNSSVGEFGADTLTASTNAIESTTPGDAKFTTVNRALTALDQQRDALANAIKTELYNAENRGTPSSARAQILLAKLIIAEARHPRRAARHVPPAPGDVQARGPDIPGCTDLVTQGARQDTEWVIVAV